jgi:transitional endoplasmic reticulum ATPase
MEKEITNSKIHSQITSYEQRQKEKLVELGNSNKSYKNILAYLEAEIKQSTKISTFNYKIKCFKDDGVYQLNRAIEEIYGSVNFKKDENPSGSEGTIQTLDITLASGERIKTLYGKIALPEAGDGACIDISYDSSSDTLLVAGNCEFRYSSMIDEIVKRTEDLLKTDSIYKNQAIELDDSFTPRIMDLSSYDEEFVVLSDQAKYELQPLMHRILYSEKCKAKGIPLKTGVLLDGAYGTGKTLLAFKIASDAIKNSWSFIYLKEPTHLARTLRLAKTLDQNGNGVIIFLEDLDQIARGNRDAAMQDILNTLDGGDTKSMNVISIFTTNHLELIEPTFLRGKRIGSIISLGFLDRKTAMEYITITFTRNGYSVDPTNMDKVCELIENSNIAPAFMAEICESVKSHMIYSDDMVIKAEYIENAVKSYLRQVNIAKKKDMSETDESRLADSLRKVISKDILKLVKEQKEYIESKFG